MQYPTRDTDLSVLREAAEYGTSVRYANVPTLWVPERCSAVHPHYGRCTRRPHVGSATFHTNASGAWAPVITITIGR